MFQINFIARHFIELSMPEAIYYWGLRLSNSIPAFGTGLEAVDFLKFFGGSYDSN
jgi:hypothetical protein